MPSRQRLGLRQVGRLVAAASVAAGLTLASAATAAAASPPILTAQVGSAGNVTASWDLPPGQQAQIVWAGRSPAVNQYGELTDHTAIGQLSSSSATSTTLNLQPGTWYLQVWTKAPDARQAAAGCPIVVSPYAFCYSNVVTVVVPGGSGPAPTTPRPTFPSTTTTTTITYLVEPTMHKVAVSGSTLSLTWTIPAGQIFEWVYAYDLDDTDREITCTVSESACRTVVLPPGRWRVYVAGKVIGSGAGLTIGCKPPDYPADRAPTSRCYSEGQDLTIPVGQPTTTAGTGPSPSPSPSRPRAGGAVDVRGVVEVLHADGTWRRLAADAVVRSFDRIRTGPTGRLHVRLDDGTQLRLGANSDLVIDEFFYDPKAPTIGSVAATVTKGTFRWVTGKVKGNQPANRKVKDPVGVIGIRGTDFVARYDPASRVTTIWTNSGLVTFTPNGTRTSVDVAAGRTATVPAKGEVAVRRMTPKEWKALTAGL